MAKHTIEDIKLKNKIKQRITNILEARGITQSNLADLSEKDRQAVNRWINPNNDRGITIYSLSNICKTLNMTLKDFFDDHIFNDI